MMTFEYSVKQSNYVDYLTRRNNFISTQSEDLKNGKSIYYLIFKGTEYVTDFVVYKEDNWMSISDEDLKNEQMVKEVLTILSQVYDHIVLIVGSGEINTINFLISNFSTTNEQIQAEDNDDTQNIFNKITIRLK